jgi:DNA-binding response OmpR family regulator
MKAAPKTAHVLLVERDPLLGELYYRKLAQGNRVSVARHAQGAVDVLDSAHVDLIVMDVLVGKHNGIELLYEIRSYDDWMSIPVIILSSLPVENFPIAPEAWADYGVVDWLYKASTRPGDLAAAVNEALAA